jgi:hypothetical protein
MTKVASWEKKKRWATSILKAVVMTTLRHTTKKQTTPLSVVLELGSRIFSNARLVLKLATLVIYYNSLNLASFSRGVTSGSDFFYRGLWSDVSPSSHPPC